MRRVKEQNRWKQDRWTPTVHSWALPWTPLWDVSWGVLEGLKNREIGPRGCPRGRTRGATRGPTRGPHSWTHSVRFRGPTSGPTRGSRFAFACSVRRPMFAFFFPCVDSFETLFGPPRGRDARQPMPRLFSTPWKKGQRAKRYAESAPKGSFPKEKGQENGTGNEKLRK